MYVPQLVRRRLLAFREAKLSSALSRSGTELAEGGADSPLSAAGSSQNMRSVLSGVKTFVTRREGVLR